MFSATLAPDRNNRDGRPNSLIAINAAHVVSVRENDGYTEILTVCQVNFTVLESFKEIVQRVERGD